MVKVTGETSWVDLEDKIRQVPLLQDRDGEPFYPYADAEITLERISLAEVSASTLYVVRRNLATQRRLSCELAAQDFDPLELEGGLSIEADDEAHNLTPPIIEEVPEHPRMALDGHHRLYNALGDRIEAFVAVVITNIHPEALAYAIPNRWEEVVEYDEAPTDPSLKKVYRSPENSYALYRNFGGVNGSAPREAQ